MSDKQYKEILSEMERGLESGVSWREVLQFENVPVHTFAGWIDRSAERRERFAQIRKGEKDVSRL